YAFHEAGHAVAALVLGLRLLGVSLVPSKAHQMRPGVLCRTEGRVDLLVNAASHFARAVCDYAGPAAERLVSPDAVDAGDAADDEHARAVCPDPGMRTRARQTAAELVR